MLSFDDEDYEQARTHYDAAIVAEPRLREAHYNLGHTLQRLGREGEAIDAYRHAVEVDPSYARAWLNLANALHCEGCWEEALHAYQRFLELRPEHPSALHMIAAIEGRTTDRCPPQFVAELFDSYADEFDEVLVEDLGYQTPSAMARVILEEQPGRHFERILDLGCGTGLVGQALRPHGRRLIGVDLSSEMIAQAAARGVYDELIQAELVEFLVGAAESFDLIVAADVFVYLGDLEPVVSAAHGLVAPRGRFAFSTEASASEGFALRRSGRFAHHFRYVEQLVGRYGFGLATRQDLTLRHDHGEPVAGHLFLLCA